MMLLEEKQLKYTLVFLSPEYEQETINKLSPIGKLPVLKEKNHLLYDADIILYYIDERYPSPSLMPNYPLNRAQIRLTIRRFQREWMTILSTPNWSKGKQGEKNKKHFKNTFTSLMHVFETHVFFNSDEITLADCYLCMILHHLQLHNITFDAQTSIGKYCAHMFNREAFQTCISKHVSNIKHTS